jgi:ZIP family zinc transporter
MVAALGWGTLAAASLVLGALLAFARHWHPVQVGVVMAFGSGALISAVSFELVQEGFKVGGGDSTAIGLGLGALTYYLLDGLIARRFEVGRGRSRRASGSSPGPALALGAFLDGVPEQMVLGIGLAAGEGVSFGLLVAIFVSNLPEAIGSATEMHEVGTGRATILRLWVTVAAICTLATVAGFGIADTASADLRAGIDGFAAGALLVMLIDAMIPEARRKSGRVAGLVTVLGFAVAGALSAVS